MTLVVVDRQDMDFSALPHSQRRRTSDSRRPSADNDAGHDNPQIAQIMGSGWGIESSLRTDLGDLGDSNSGLYPFEEFSSDFYSSLFASMGIEATIQ